MRAVLMGNHAISYGAKLARVQVIAAYPITPQSQVVEMLSEMCAEGELKAKFIHAESEHSAMTACIGASSTGARAFTATSAQGLALMHEMLHWASGARLPIVMANVNRALGPPWSLWADQIDSLSQRDTGWMQFYCEANQELLDSVILGYKVAERVHLPAMVLLDGFFLSHTSEPVDLPSQEEVDAFLPPYKPPYVLDPDDPTHVGGLATEDYMEMRYMMHESMVEALEVYREECALFHEHFGREYKPLEPYRCEDAEVIVVTAGTISGTARVATDRCRDEGIPVGRLKFRMLRPFPYKEVCAALKDCRRIAVIDRNYSVGMGGIFAQEIKAALQATGQRQRVYSCIAGLGGRDVTPEAVREAVDVALERGNVPEVGGTFWIGLKG